MGYRNASAEKMWVSVDGRSRTYALRQPVRRPLCVKSHSTTLSSEVAALGIILAVIQVIDGVLTGFGMAHFGTQMEGNALLRGLMHAIGFIPALILVKGASILIIASLCTWASKVKWLRHAFRGIIALYLVAAIGPWSFIHLMQLLT